MKLATIQIKYDTDKLAALRQYADRKEISLDDEISDTITKLYEKHVPAAVREYIDFNATESAESTQKPKKSTPIPASIEQSGRPAVIPATGADENEG